jgi:hypothetical protein
MDETNIKTTRIIELPESMHNLHQFRTQVPLDVNKMSNKKDECSEISETFKDQNSLHSFQSVNSSGPGPSSKYLLLKNN